jgi:hypothetical protein
MRLVDPGFRLNDDFIQLFKRLAKMTIKNNYSCCSHEYKDMCRFLPPKCRYREIQ